MENFLEHQIGFDEYITGNKFIDICEQNSATFCKTDYLYNYKNSMHKVFVTHNSDYHIDQNRCSIAPACEYWFAQNKDNEIPWIVSIPIGLENMKLRTSPKSQGSAYSSEVPGALQKAVLLDRINSFNLEKKLMCYMNFNIRTYPVERQMVWDKFSSFDWVTKTSNLSMEQFYFDIASHKFILSPRGNGVDCHRTWEALYLRTIPIVRRSTHMKEFEDLPIFFVDNWDEICYIKLEEFFNKVKSSLYDLNKLKISHWKQRINDALCK